MTQYNTLNVKLSNSQLNKLKSGIKNGTEVTLNLSSTVIGNSNDKINFPHRVLLADTQVSKICKAFPNGSSKKKKKKSKNQLFHMIQLGRFFPFLESALKAVMQFLTIVDNIVKKVFQKLF